MEQWSFPARHDESHLPATDGRYWFPLRETMPAAERERAIVLRLQEVCRYAYKHATIFHVHPAGSPRCP